MKFLHQKSLERGLLFIVVSRKRRTFSRSSNSGSIWESLTDAGTPSPLVIYWNH